MHTCAGSPESLSHVALKYQNIKTLYNVRRQFNFNRAGSHALHACADPEHIVRGVVREDRNATKNGPPSTHQRNAIEMAFCWRVDNGPPLNAGLVAL